jgi:hypothetical protein
MTISVHTIIKCVTELTGISVVNIQSDQRARDIVHARFIVVGLARTYTRYSLPRIGRALGSRDHSTIIHATHRCNALVQSDPEFATLYSRAEAQLKSAIGNAPDPSLDELIFTDHIAAMLLNLDTLIAATETAINQLRSRHARLAYARTNLDSLKDAA